METPSSMRRVTRSQTSLSSQKKKKEEAAEKSMSSRSRTQGVKPEQRSVLLDITNDSPIVGLAMGSLKTPSSAVPGSKGWANRTPGSGEALLRGQVKTLLQKVEEEAELVKLCAEQPAPFRSLLAHLKSPAGLLAPTPANTPQISGLSGDNEGFMSAMPSVQGEEGDSKGPQAAEILKQEETLNLHECLINRALLFDSPGKSEVSDSSSIVSSALTYQGSQCGSGPEKFPEDDCSSGWSMQVNASARQEEEEDRDFEGVQDFEDADVDDEEEEEHFCEAEDEEADGESLDALCNGLRTMSVREKKRGLPESAGKKHTVFIYNGDDEIEREEEIEGCVVSPGVLLLKGLPVPQGKHLRFHEEEEEEED